MSKDLIAGGFGRDPETAGFESEAGDRAQIGVDDPEMPHAQLRVPLRLQLAIVAPVRRRQDLDDEERRRFDPAPRDVFGFGSDDEVGDEDVVRRQDQVDWRVEDLAYPTRLEVVLELALEPLGHPLMDGARRGVHEHLPSDELVPPAADGVVRDVFVGELSAELRRHVDSTPGLRGRETGDPWLAYAW